MDVSNVQNVVTTGSSDSKQRTVGDLGNMFFVHLLVNVAAVSIAFSLPSHCVEFCGPVAEWVIAMFYYVIFLLISIVAYVLGRMALKDSVRNRLGLLIIVEVVGLLPLILLLIAFTLDSLARIFPPSL